MLRNDGNLMQQCGRNTTDVRYPPDCTLPVTAYMLHSSQTFVQVPCHQDKEVGYK